MARNNPEGGDTAEVTTEATETAGAATTTEGGSDNRFISLNVPEGDPSGLVGSQKRVDVIRALAKTGDWTRGDIAKHVSKLQGTKVAYQIVFQATKGIPNVKAAPRATAEAAPAEGETAAS